MAVPFIQNSFASGELAPTMWGRTDLARYKSGLAVSRNFFVDYRGGVSTRAGTGYVGPCPTISGAVRPWPFIFSSTQAYVVEFTDSLIRFIYQGAYVTETPLAISTVSNAYPAIFTVSGSSFSNGSQVYINGIFGMERSNGISGVNGRTFVIDEADGDTFAVYDPISGVFLDGTTLSVYLGGGTAALIYSVASPYAGADLALLKFTQSADVLDIAHPSYQPAQLKRMGPADWALDVIDFQTTIAAPANVVFQALNGPTGTGTVLGYNYCVTAISNATGEESLKSSWVGGPNNPLNQDTGVANKLTWDAVSGAVGYKIYAALPVLFGSAGPPPYFVGYIGTTTGLSFQDTNIEPDFSQVPPMPQNPFALGPITGTDLLDAGFGYVEPRVQITDPTGSGAVITATADTSGNGSITSLTVSNGGSNYSSPTLDIVDASGVGRGLTVTFSGSWTNVGGSSWSPAPDSITISNGGTNYHSPTINLEVSTISNVTDGDTGFAVGLTTGSVVTSLDVIKEPVFNTNDGMSPPANALYIQTYDGTLNGEAIAQAVVEGENNPGVVSYFDQRKVFAGSTKNPDTFWMSQVGLYNNFNTSFPSQSSDAITESIVSSEVNIIESLTPMAGGLIALTTSGAYQISGGTPGAALTPQSITSQAQAFSGANSLQPVRVNYDLIYSQARGSAVRDLTYNFYLNVYTGQDISAQSQHLFYGRTIVQWAYAEEPFKIIWGVRDDGILLALTIMKEQEIMGWTRHDTCGKYIGVCVIPEGNEDVAYFAVSRWLNGKYCNVMERQASRQFGGNPAANIPSNPEDAWCLDCASVLPPTPSAFDILYGQPYAVGAISSVTIMEGGNNYGAVFCQVLDYAEQGSGAAVTLTITGGRITDAVVTAVGANYVNPYLLIKDPTGAGSGAIISLGTVDTWRFFTDYSGAGSPPPPAAENGQIIRVAGGYGTISNVLGNVLYADMAVPPSGLQANTPGYQIVPYQAAGTWTLSDQVTAVGGLDQFEGCVVGIVADGNVLAPQTVVNGCITLGQPASYVLAGALYSCQAQTLPASNANEPTDQGRRKDQAAVTLRCVDTRGIYVGPSWDALVPQKERTDEPNFLPTQFTRTGTWQDYAYQYAPLTPEPPEYDDIRTVLASLQSELAQICVQQTYPMPCTLLVEVPEIAMGDTPSP